MTPSCRRFTLAWLLSIGVGCSSAPVRYYTLTAPPDESSPAAKTPIAIDVRVVHTPLQLRRSELLVRTGPTEVTLLENERWASPVSDEIKDALRVALQRRLGLRSDSTDLTTLTLDIDVQHFEAQLGRYALLDASWSASVSAAGERPPGARPATGTFHAEEKIPAGDAAMVEGYQREIAALADAIVAVLPSPTGTIDASCH